MSLCRVGWHRWAKWGPVTAHQMTTTATVLPLILGGMVTATSGPVDYTESRQERTCQSCGQIQRREVKAQ